VNIKLFHHPCPKREDQTKEEHPRKKQKKRKRKHPKERKQNQPSLETLGLSKEPRKIF
jgi:hypothetical protein